MLSERLYNELELLSRHIKVLELVLKKQPIGIVRIAQELHIGEHEARHSLKILADAGLVKATPNGAIIKGNIRDEIIKTAEVLDEVSQTARTMKREILKLVV